VVVRLSRALCHLKLEDYPAASADALACTALDPANWKGWDAAGQAAMLRREFAEAQRCFTAALTRNPMNHNISAQLAKATAMVQAGQRSSPVPPPAPEPAVPAHPPAPPAQPLAPPADAGLQFGDLGAVEQEQLSKLARKQIGKKEWKKMPEDVQQAAAFALHRPAQQRPTTAPGDAPPSAASTVCGGGGGWTSASLLHSFGAVSAETKVVAAGDRRAAPPPTHNATLEARNGVPCLSICSSRRGGRARLRPRRGAGLHPRARRGADRRRRHRPDPPGAV
jgi:tetratricopeptide (TPR) repeat protein